MEVPQVAVALISTDVPNAEQQQTPIATPTHSSATPKCGSAMPIQSVAADSTLVRGQNLQPIFEQEEDEDSEDE